MSDGSGGDGCGAVDKEREGAGSPVSFLREPVCGHSPGHGFSRGTRSARTCQGAVTLAQRKTACPSRCRGRS